MSEMIKKKLTSVERLREQENALKAKRQKLEAKLRQENRQQRRRIINIWGEAIAKALANGDMKKDDFERICLAHIPNDRQQKLALEGISDLLDTAEELPTQADNENNPTETAGKPDIETAKTGS